MRVIGERVLHDERWTLLKEKRYLDTEGREKRWTYIERQGRRRAAVIVAVTEKSGSLVIIEQFRIPFEQSIYEFPAGLIDPGESAGQAACRELAEETGFKGEVIDVGPEVCSTAGLSTETVQMVYMRVGEEPAQKPRLEGSESIRVLKLKPAELAGFLADCEGERRILDAKLFTYIKENIHKG
jgi:8-oxo-dGTP pyrophosphatase MutT (NUDIX family)